MQDSRINVDPYRNNLISMTCGQRASIAQKCTFVRTTRDMKIDVLTLEWHLNDRLNQRYACISIAADCDAVISRNSPTYYYVSSLVLKTFGWKWGQGGSQSAFVLYWITYITYRYVVLTSEILWRNFHRRTRISTNIVKFFKTSKVTT